MLRKTSLVLSVLLFVGVNSLASSKDTAFRKIASLSNLESIKSTAELFPHEIKKDSSLYLALSELGVEPLLISSIADAARPIYNLSRLMPGTRFRVFYKSDASPLLPSLNKVSFLVSNEEVLDIKNLNGNWTATKIKQDIEKRVVTFSGLVAFSLWDSAQSAGMSPSLVTELAEIFAWQIDFAREVRINDRWRISVEQKWLRGEPIGWGNILVAEYENDGRLFTAIRFEHKGKNLGYFSPEGESLRKMFLKSPIKFGRISSRFQHRRFHPVLKVNRPHFGVDYAAPRGTPIRAVGSGKVSFASKNCGAGNMITIRHNSVYKTSYKHLHRFAKGVRRGKQVEQGQIIGYVGSTGLSTGPHLHFEFFKHGTYVDPLKQSFPSADPIPSELMADFQNHSNYVSASLPNWEATEISQK